MSTDSPTPEQPQAPSANQTPEPESERRSIMSPGSALAAKLLAATALAAAIAGTLYVIVDRRESRRNPPRR